MAKLLNISLSGFLMLAIALAVPAQTTAPAHDQATKKQAVTHKGTASKEDIRNAQQALKDKGMYTGAVDGTINAETEKALRDFQEKNSLQVTGTLNHDTMKALGVKSSAGTSSSKAGTSGTSTTTTPKKEKTGKPTSNISNEKIRKTQSALKKEGFNPGPVDGIMGPMTTAALRDFQSHKGLEVTGTMNTETQKALSARGAPTTTRSKPTVSKSEHSGVSSKATVSSVEDVRAVQQALTDLMYDPGDINGLMTSKTRQAVR